MGQRRITSAWMLPDALVPRLPKKMRLVVVGRKNVYLNGIVRSGLSAAPISCKKGLARIEIIVNQINWKPAPVLPVRNLGFAHYGLNAGLELRAGHVMTNISVKPKLINRHCRKDAR